MTRQFAHHHFFRLRAVVGVYYADNLPQCRNLSLQWIGKEIMFSEANMVAQKVDAVFENGVFRPLQPVHLPEHQRVTVLLPVLESMGASANAEASYLDDDMDQEIEYRPLPLQQCGTIRVQLRRGADLEPLPYPLDHDEMNADEMEHE